MIRIIWISIPLLIFINHSWASVITLSGSDFYGKWSTTSSVLSPKRQILEISEKNSTWTSIYDDGKQKTLSLTEENITIEGDLLKIDYKYPDGNYRLKLILGGWIIGEQKKIFGTVYMYANEGNGLQLFNGIQMDFTNGIDEIPPQSFWSFFQEPEKKTQNVEPAYFQRLEAELSQVDEVKVREDDHDKVYELKRIGYTIIVTKKGNHAHPSAIGIRQSPRYPGEMQLKGRYAGEGVEFMKLYDSYLGIIEKQKAEVLKHLPKVVDRIDDSKTSK